jgi:hypothetical protein
MGVNTQWKDSCSGFINNCFGQIESDEFFGGNHTGCAEKSCRKKKGEEIEEGRFSHHL